MILEKVSGVTDIEEDMKTDGIRNRNSIAIENSVNANTSDIASNAGNIANNASNIANNASNITANADDLSALAPIALGFKGRNLQTLWGLPTAQATFARLREISSTGDFTGLRLGDYITIPSMTIGGVTYTNKSVQIMGFDHYYGVGSPAVTTHHVLMQFTDTVLKKRMNATDTNAGGYPASELASWLYTTFKPGLVSAIGLTPVSINRYLDNHAKATWLSETVFIPTEIEVTGTQVWNTSLEYVGEQRQFLLNVMHPKIGLPTGYSWLASTSSIGIHFSSVFPEGNIYLQVPTNTYIGVCPAFCI